MDAQRALRACQLFASVDNEAIDALAELARPVEVRGGSVLFEAGSAPDAMYLVVTGRLSALGPDGPLGEIGVLETVGEIGIVADEPRIATVRALRDSQLLRLDRQDMLLILMRYPHTLLELSRVIIERLRYNRRQQRRASLGLRSLCIIAAQPLPELDAAIDQLAAALDMAGVVRVLRAEAVDAELGAGTSAQPFVDSDENRRLTHWLNAVESECDLLVYVAGPDAGPWLRRCLRQSDRVLLAIDAAAEAVDNAVVGELRALDNAVPVELFARDAATMVRRTRAWRELTGAASQYYWRAGVAEDFERIARQLCGRAIGLVLGGGGARGFAHIGLIRALEQFGLPIDLAGGASMGAFMAALVARGHDALEMTAIARETFVERNYLNDYMIPRVALIRGRKFLERLREIFGELQVEELPREFYCVSTDLTSGQPVVHTTGSLAIWVGTSMSVPGVAPPVGYNGHLLADGSVVNSLPTDIMLERGRGPIVASDVSTAGQIAAPGVAGPDPGILLNWQADTPRPGLIDILFRTSTLTSESGVKARAALADLYLRMPVRDVGLFDWDAIDQIIEQGYAHAMGVLETERERLQAVETTEPLI